MVNIPSLSSGLKAALGGLGIGVLMPEDLIFASIGYYLWRRFCPGRDISKMKIPDIERRLAYLETERKARGGKRDRLVSAKNRLEDELKTITDELKRKIKTYDIKEKEEAIKAEEKKINAILVEHDFFTHLERAIEHEKALKVKGKWVWDDISVLCHSKKYAKERRRLEQKLKELTDKGILVDEHRAEIKEILEREERIWSEL